MAVAVKTSPETSTPRSLGLPALSLVGVIYVLGCLGIVFGAIPKLWWSVWPPSFSSSTCLALAMVAAATGLMVLGAKLIGPKALDGLKAGIFVGLVGFLVILLLTDWFGFLIEKGVYQNQWFGDAGKTVGLGLTAALGIILLVLGIRLFSRPATERTLVRIEHQGWFEATAYKRQQGLRVRRGTMLGILLIVGAGIYTLISHGKLQPTMGHSPNWELNIPFTGKVIIDPPFAANREGKRVEGYSLRKKDDTYEVVDKAGKVVPEGKVVDPAGDVRPELNQRWPGAGDPINGSRIVMDRFELRDFNKQADPNKFVKLIYANDAQDLKQDEGKIIPKDTFEKAKANLWEKFKQSHEGLGLSDAEMKAERDKFERESLPKAVAPTPASGPVQYAVLPLLPSVQYTVPVLLMAVTIWLSWRIVNMPTFADFLIATEAELNKVSWTTGRRLRQDTIVVLITVVLMSVYLFGMDQAWRWLLSRDIIGTLQFPKNQAEIDKSVEQKPW
jgi:preprotein translocase SecE subunit